MYDVQLVLKALTPEMELAFRGPSLAVQDMPFRIGRESRDPRTARSLPPDLHERRANQSPRSNDLYIVDPGPRLFISRQHLLIERRENGFFLVDLFSACGTIVEGKVIGGDHRGGEVPLEHQDVIIIGTAASPIIFKLLMV